MLKRRLTFFSYSAIMVVGHFWIVPFCVRPILGGISYKRALNSSLFAKNAKSLKEKEASELSVRIRNTNSARVNALRRSNQYVRLQ